MDEVRSFLNNPCPSKSQRVKLRGPLTGGVSISKHDALDEMNRKPEQRHSVVPSGTDYTREVRKKETEMYLRYQMERKECESLSEGLESLELLTSMASSVNNVGVLNDEAMTEVYNRYTFTKKEDTTNKLAINIAKQKILNAIQSSEVLVIEGPTGCGKTTQVPQWILDECVQNHRPCKIVITQPRRIAAISIAKRVAQERGWDVGSIVGYQVGLENRTSTDTRISYVTTGVLLQKLINSKTMSEYTHVILDEVHERGQEMDFLLLVVKRLLFTVSPHVKVVLMSATIRANQFTDYFRIHTPLGMQSSQCIKIEKSNQMFKVKTFYLNDLKQFGAILQQSTPKNSDPCILPEMHHLVLKLVNAFETIDQKEDGYTDRSQADLPSILIFLPGINEIEDLYMCLTNEGLRAKIAGPQCARYNWWVLPLHSTITADEQVRVFQRAQPGCRKIILATNIAESSITVPDIKYVVDYCLMKTLVADERTNFTALELSWAAKSNCDQRAGRAGRVRDGRVYRLVNDLFYQNLPDEVKPEILRSPLDRLVLLAKLLDAGPPCQVLALALDPPDLANINRTVLVLKELGALKKTFEDEYEEFNGDLTYLGRVMAKLPLDVKASKLIMLGYIYGCLEESIVMAAALSAKNVFSSPFRERLNAFNSKLTWADGSTSDCIAFLNVYKVWSHLRQQNYFKQQGNSEVHWASRFYVQVRALRETDDLVRELKQRLSREGIEPAKGNSPWTKNEVPLVLKVILAGAFYPQYFIQVSQDEDRERNAVKILGGLDPRNTVYLKNFPDNQPGVVYAKAIKNVIRQQIADEPRVIFDSNSQKVFLTFNDGFGGMKQRDRDSGDPTIPGQVVLPVYKSIKARQLKMDIRIPLLPVEKAQALASEMAAREETQDLERMVPRLPDIDQTYFPLKICQLNNLSDFWVQNDDESTASDLYKIHSILNKAPLMAHTDTIECGDLYAAPFNDGYCRARVLKLLPRGMVKVHFIDIGAISSRVSSTKLRILPPGLCEQVPPLAMRCRLAAVAPPPLLDPHGNWTPHVINLFNELCSRGPLLGKVYSVVQGVVAIGMFADSGQTDVNQILLRDGHAVACEESYESKMNHDLRQSANDLNLGQRRAFNIEQTKLAYNQLREIEPPSPRECISDVCLKGPFSPLESNLYPLLLASREKHVTIEWSSVNSVLLDTAPQETYERLIVAASVGQNEMNSKMTLRHTTLMPNIPGLPAIISLLFCPTAELRRDEDETRYVSALCGLGSDLTGKPYFPEHDLLLTIDADMSVDDIGAINHIRHLMDMMMYCNDGQDMPTPDDEMHPNIPKIIRADIMKLLKKHRTQREAQYVPNAWQWRSVPEDEKLEISVPEMMERAVVYPLHAPQELHPVTREHMLTLKRDNDNLKLLVGRTPISSAVQLSCKLCNTTPMPTHAMRIHLYSNAHMEKEEDFQMYQS